jgi:hypothetical protein
LFKEIDHEDEIDGSSNACDDALCCLGTGSKDGDGAQGWDGVEHGDADRRHGECEREGNRSSRQFGKRNGDGEEDAHGYDGKRKRDGTEGWDVDGKWHHHE